MVCAGKPSQHSHDCAADGIWPGLLTGMNCTEDPRHLRSPAVKRTEFYRPTPSRVICNQRVRMASGRSLPPTLHVDESGIRI